MYMLKRVFTFNLDHSLLEVFTAGRIKNTIRKDYAIEVFNE